MRGLDKFPSRWLGALLAAIVSGAMMSPAVRAQTPAPAPDFSQGFELLRKAGLPDTKDWKYVRLESDYLRGSEMSIDAMLPGKQAGNAWLEPKSGSSKLQRILIDGSSLMAVAPDSDGREDYAAHAQAAGAMGLQFVPGKVKDVGFASGDAKQNNEAADAERLATGLMKLAADDEGKERLMQYRGQIVNVFFMAAHYHRRGHVKESAQIVAGLQQVLPRPEALIELSVEKLGDWRLEQSVARFRGDRDWKALQSSLEVVMADFPELWSSRPLAERLLAQVKTRSAGQAPPPVADGPFPLTGEQTEWWNKVTTASPAEKKLDEEAMLGMMQSPGSEQWAQAWLVKRMEIPADLNRYWGSVEGESLAPFDPSKDWDWILVMAAALGDNTLTMNFGLNRHGMFDSTWSSFDAEEAPAEPSEMELDQRWEQLGAPLTRDDIARAFLGTVLPLSDEYSGPEGAKRMSVEDLREIAKSWGAKSAGKKGLELARLYFKEGSEMHRRIMASVLARTGDEKDFALLEEVALSAPQNNLELAMQILQKRKAAGKSFLEKFKARLMEEFQENSRSSETIPDYIKGQLTALDGLVSGKGMKELLADYADKKMDERAFMQSVHSLQEGYEWKQEDIEAAFDVMAKIPASEGKRRFMILEMTSRALMSMLKVEWEAQAPAGTDTGTGAEEKPGETPPPDWVVKLLKQFIEQNREVKISGWVGSDIRLSQYGCFLLDSLWKSGDMIKAREIFQQLPQDESWSYMEARGMARLEGRQPPPLPDAARVPEARKAEIKAAVEKIKEGGWPDFYSSLSLDEKLAAVEPFKGLEPDDSWKKTLLTVTDVKLDAQDAAATAVKPESWMAMKTRVLDGALAKQVLELCQQAYKDGGKNVTGMANALSHYRGMVLTVGVANDDEFRESDVASWITSVQNEDAASALSAIAYVRWRDRSGSGAMMAVRGKDGVWKMHAGDEPPPGFADVPFNPVLAADAFEKAFNDFLASWPPKQQTWNLDFGVYKVPAEAAAKE